MNKKTKFDFPEFERNMFTAWIKIKGNQNNWYISEDKNGDMIYQELDQDSDEGIIIVYDGKEVRVHHANSFALKEDTGEDLTDNYPSIGLIARKREMNKRGVFEYSDIVHQDDTYVLGPQDRLEKMARSMSERPLFMLRVSPSGTEELRLDS